MSKCCSFPSTLCCLILSKLQSTQSRLSNSPLAFMFMPPSFRLHLVFISSLFRDPIANSRIIPVITSEKSVPTHHHPAFYRKLPPSGERKNQSYSSSCRMMMTKMVQNKSCHVENFYKVGFDGARGGGWCVAASRRAG